MATTTWTASEESEIKSIMESTGTDRKTAIRKMRSASKSKSTKTNAASEQVPKLKLEELLKVVIPVAAKFKSHYGSTKKLIGENKQHILQLFDLFGVSQGKPGKKLDIEDNSITRDEFITVYFGCTPKYMLQELGIKKTKAEGESKKKKPEDTENYKLGHAAGVEFASTDNVKAEIKDGVNKKYERQLGELEAKLKTKTSHSEMLSKILDAIEKVGDHVPLPLIELAKSMREVMRTKNVVAETEKTLATATAGLAEAKSVVAKLDADASRHMVARIEGSDEFGVFMKSACAPFTAAKAVGIFVTQEKAIESLRERDAAKKKAQAV